MLYAIQLWINFFNKKEENYFNQKQKKLQNYIKCKVKQRKNFFFYIALKLLSIKLQTGLFLLTKKKD